MRLTARLHEWERWFAWRPVMIPHYGLVWLTWVARRVYYNPVFDQIEEQFWSLEMAGLK